MAKRDYAGEFNTLVEGVGYQLVSPYVKSTEKVKIQCDKNHEYEVTPSDFKQGNRCPVCSGQCTIQAKKEFEELVIKEGYKLLSPYVKSKEKVSLQCDQGHIYKVIPKDFKQGNRCPVCAGNCRIPKKEVEYKIKLICKAKGYVFNSIIGDYTGIYNKLNLTCANGHNWKSTNINSFFNLGTGCPKCAKNGFDPDKPATLYLTELHSDVTQALKFGITNREVETRMNEHSKESEYNHSIIHSVSHSDGQLILDLENLIKEKVSTHYLTKEQLPDGYTETTNVANRGLILGLMDKFELLTNNTE